MRRLFAMFFLLLTSVVVVLAQTTSTPTTLTPEQKASAMAKAKSRFETMKSDDFKKIVVKQKSRVPEKKNVDINVLRQNATSSSSKSSAQLQGTSSVMPSNFSVPGEFEESQATILGWSYFAVDANGEDVYSLTKDLALKYLSQTEYEIVPIAGYVLDTFDESPYAVTWARLANELQKELPVWIVLYSDSDTTKLKDYMQSKGMPLTNYKFIITGGGNAFWMRDFGPIGFYYGEQDSVGLLDFEYYPDRPADDDFNKDLSALTGYKRFESSFEIEGGNIISDGFGRLWTSSAVYSGNQDTDGKAYVDSSSGSYELAYTKKTRLTTTQIRDTLKSTIGTDTVAILTTLRCDGGTGHIDMYCKLFDSETFIISEYPTAFNKSSFSDYATVRTNVTSLKKQQGEYNRAHRIFRMPVPTGDNGEYDSTTCQLFSADPRGFLNGLTINKTFIFPAFSDSTTGNREQTEQAKQLYQKYLPGYNVIPFDARNLTPMAGAVHCITMQVPAENPIRFTHKAWRDNVEQRTEYPIAATIKNKSGVANSTLFWRIKGSSTWNSQTLTSNGTEFTSAIPGDTSAQEQTIEYYISATSNNGKTSVLPIVAPNGYFSFTYGKTVVLSVDNIVGAEVQTPFPSPASTELNIPIHLQQNGNVQITLYSVTGESVAHYNLGAMLYGTSIPRISVAGIQPGVYALSVSVNAIPVATKKVILQ